MLKAKVFAQTGVDDSDSNLQMAGEQTVRRLSMKHTVINGQHFAQMDPPEQQDRMSS
jgi:hypothetical protein